MALCPRRGEHWQHKEGWSVYVIGVKYREEIRNINPEFYCEVKFIYENSGEYTEMPLSWFCEVYRRIGSGGEYFHSSGTQRGTIAPDYSWLNDDDN